MYFSPVILILVFVIGTARAADFYVTAKGEGARTGRSWSDAFAFAAINDVLNRTMQLDVKLGGGGWAAGFGR